MKVPNGWERKRLGEVADFLDGQRKPVKEEDRAKMKGPYPYFGASGIIDHVNDYLFDEDLVLLGEDGENILSRQLPLAFRVSGKIWVNNHAHVIRPRNHMDADFLTAYLESISYVQFNTGTAQPKLNKEVCESILVPVPPLPEQKRIAMIVGAWEEAIDKVGKLIEAKQKLKRGLMQQLLRGDRRFRAFKDQKWQRKRLRDVAQRVTRKNDSGCSHVLTASGEHGLVDQAEFFDRAVASEDLSDYFLLRKGEFAYNRSSMNGYPFGATKRLERYEEGVLSILYICFRVDETHANPDFMAHLFDSGLLNRGLRAITQVGARAHGLLNVTPSDFMELEIELPSMEEQLAITNTLSTANREIEVLAASKGALEQQKRGLMQKLLNGEIRVKAAATPSEIAHA